MKRKYSNNEVKAAGKILTKPSEFSELELENAQNILTYWRTIHAYPINTFQATLRDKIKRLGFQDTLVAQRLKRSVSIVSKLERFSNMKLSTMQDISGLRAILNDISEVRIMEESYLKSKFKHKLKGYKDYINEPAPTGYRGIHLIYQYVNEQALISNGLRIEIQIRTKLQHAWATAVETMGTFLDQSLKSSQGSDSWLEYFSLVSSGFSLLEESPVQEKYRNLSKKDVYKKIMTESDRLNVSQRLNAFTLVAEHIIRKDSSSKYNLITLDLKEKIIDVRSYPARKLEQANIDYTNIEKEINKGAPLQSVLVSTGSIDSLKKSYPSFFLDSQEFLNKLNLIFAKLQEL
jgi:ppGpp synthetase/RelA/SpoT-type nucleotidyltranferase